MSWKVVDDVKLIANARRELRVIGMRTVVLDPEEGLDELMSKGPMGVSAAHRLEIRIFKSHRGLVSVFDAATVQPVGWYVWSGDGGPVVSSRDERVVLLANQLAEEFQSKRGETE